MKLLLDTHVWLWSVISPAKLNRNVRRELLKSTNELYLSPISIWEAQHLVKVGRVRLGQRFPQWLEQVLREMRLKEAPFNFAVAEIVAQIELPHPDFGDVLLAATASTYDLTLVTSDSQLLACSWLKTLSND